MNFYLTALFIGAVLITMPGCKGGGDAKPESETVHVATERDSEKGAWLGKGTFHSQHGNEDVTAQLELLKDGRYRFMVLEPRVLMMLGAEQGTYTRADGSVHLTPTKGQKSEGKGVLARVPKDFRPKTLAIEANNSVMTLKDEGMDLMFVPNVKATEKLRETGDI